MGYTGERMVNVVGKSSTPFVPELAERLREDFPITTFLFSAYDGLSDVAGADRRDIFWGDGAIQERLDGKAVEWMEQVSEEQYRARSRAPTREES